MPDYEKMTRSELIRELEKKDAQFSAVERTQRIRNQVENIFLSVPDEEVYADVLAVLLEATQSRLGFFGFIDDNGDLVIPSLTRDIRHQCGVAENPVTLPRQAWGDSPWGKAIKERKSFFSDGTLSIPEGHIPIRNFLTTPIVFADRCVGVLAVANREGGYTEEEADLLNSIASNISPILNARMQRDRQEKDRMLAEEELLLAKFCIDRASIGVFQISERGKIRTVNDYACQSLGYTMEELCSMTVFDIDPTFSTDVFIEHRRKLAEAGSRTFETSHRRKDGSIFPVEVTVNLLEFRGRKFTLSFARDITERKRAEDELRLTQFCVDKASIAFYQLAEGGEIWNANECACHSLGYSMDELRAMTVFDIDPELTTEVFNYLATSMFTCGSITFERRHRRKDGTSFPVEITSNSVEFSGRRFGINFVKDITERKAAEKSLRESEARLKMAMDLAKLVQWEYDVKTGMFIFDDQFYALYGTTGDREGGALMSAEAYARKFVPHEEAGVVAWGIADVLAKSSTQLEHRIIRGDGEERFIVVRGEAVRDDTGRVVKIRGANQDITERRRMEEELRLAHDELEKRVAERTGQLERALKDLKGSEERYGLAVKGSNDAIWDLNLITGELYFSPRMNSILGEDTPVIRSVEDFRDRIHPDDRPRVRKRYDAYIEGHVPVFEIEHRLRHRNGNYVWVINRAACLRESGGKPYRMAGSVTDVTERKKLEQQLLQSQKMESIGVLAGGVAHDFNNLLTTIAGYAEILLEVIPEDDELSHDSIQNVLNAVDRAAELTRGLLAFSRKQVISPRPVDICTLISNTTKLIKRTIGEDIEFSTDFSGGKLVVNADSGQIEQVLMNLAANARDAMPGGGKASISTRQVVVDEGSESLYDLPSAGKYVLISIADTGMGIEKEALENIFEPFFTTKEVGKGTGLGLSIVHGIIKQHNGSILARSEPGKGTTFDIFLPLDEEHSPQEEPIFAGSRPPGKETVLVVEDEESVRMFMKKVLKLAGYNVIIAGDGEEAVARFREHDDISLVLSDLVMPRKNGREMLDELRRIKPEVKAVFISGYAADVMQEKGMFEEGTDFIGKPFKKDELLRKIREVLDRN